MRFDLVDLRLFLNVHEAGTITGGAAASHMTLASASERVRGMEDALGTTLFVRERKGVVPTAAGNTLLHHARLVLAQIDRLQGALLAHGHGGRGHIRLLSNTSALSEHLPDLLARFLAAQRGVSIDVEERPSSEIVDALLGGTCDIGIVSDAVDASGLETFDFAPDPLVVVMARDHPLAARASLALADIADEAFVGLVEPSALQAHIAQHARRIGKRLDHRIRLGSFEAICRMVGAGIGIGIVPRAVAIRCTASSRIKRAALSDPWAMRNLRIAVRRYDALAAHAQRLVTHLRSSKKPASRRASRHG
jgi:DNA-binding transcriptional LysR family regulator